MLLFLSSSLNSEEAVVAKLVLADDDVLLLFSGSKTPTTLDEEEGFADTTLALEDVDRLRKTVESWLRKTLEEDELFAPLLDTSSSLNDSYVIAIAQKLSEANRQQLEKEEKIDEGNNDASDAQ